MRHSLWLLVARDICNQNQNQFCTLLHNAHAAGPKNKNASASAVRIPFGPLHMLLWQIATIKSHDRGKRGYFGNHKVISYHLQLSRGAQPPGQLSLYLLDDINSL